MKKFFITMKDSFFSVLFFIPFALLLTYLDNIGNYFGIDELVLGIIRICLTPFVLIFLVFVILYLFNGLLRFINPLNKEHKLDDKKETQQ